MCLPEALLAPRLQLNLLPRTQSSNKDIVVHTCDRLICETLILVALRDPLQIARSDARANDAGASRTAARPAAYGCHARVRATGAALLALDLHPEGNDVVGVGVLVQVAIIELARIGPNGNKAEALREHLILDHGSVVEDEYLLNRHRGYLREEDAAECIRECRINADKVKDELHLCQASDSDPKVTAEALQ